LSQSDAGDAVPSIFCKLEARQPGRERRGTTCYRKRSRKEPRGGEEGNLTTEDYSNNMKDAKRGRGRDAKWLRRSDREPVLQERVDPESEEGRGNR